jgi:hypothetical protein
VLKHLIVLLFLFLGQGVYSQFEIIQQSTINSFEFAKVSEQHGVAIAGGATFIKSTDNGYTWTEKALGSFQMPFTLYTFIGGDIINSNTYCLIGKDVYNYKSIVIRTSDGGQTWTNVLESANGSSMYYDHIAVNNSGTVIVSTKGGVYRSTNGGVSWSFVVTGSSYQTTQILCSNSTNSDFVSNFQSKLKISADEGATWTVPNTTNLYGPSITSQNDKYLMVNSGSGIRFTMIDQNFTITGSTTFQTGLLQNNLLDKGFYLPDGKIIAHNDYTFFNYDPITNQTFHYAHQLISADNWDNVPVEITCFDLGPTYGIAVGKMGAISRFDVSAPASLTLPAEILFTFPNGCPGDLLTASPKYPAVDSVQWLVDDELVSTNFNLSHPSPLTFGTHWIKLINFLDGNSQVDSVSFYYYPLNSTPNYHLSIDTTVCYNTPGRLYFSYLNGTTAGSFISVYFNNSLFYGPVSASTSSLNIYTPIITGIDTVVFVVSRPQTCGTYYDSTRFILHVGENLLQYYAVLENKDSICARSSQPIQFTNLNSELSYTLRFLNNFPSTATYPFTGGPTDTVTVNPMNSNNFTADTMYRFKLEIRDNDNCLQSKIVDSVLQVYYPTAKIYPYSQGFYLNDTAKLVNGLISSPRLWSKDVPEGILTNQTDTIPILTSNTPSFMHLKLVNERLPGCIDSTSVDIRFGNELDALQQGLCSKKEITGTPCAILKMKEDQQGNLYVLGYYINVAMTNMTPGYVLKKFSPDKTLLWEKKAPPYSGYHYGTVMEDFEFDSNGDLYCSIWIDSDGSFADDLITYSGGIGSYKRRSYLVKINKTNGAMVWAKNVADYFPGSNLESYSATIWKISDIVISKNSDQIYFIYCYSNSMTLVHTNINGELINSSGFYLNNSMGFPSTMYVSQGSTYDRRVSYTSVKLFETSSGMISGITNFGGGTGGGGISYTGGSASVPGTFMGLLAFKYDGTTNSMSSFKRLANFNSSGGATSTYGAPAAELDKDDNMIIALKWAPTSQGTNENEIMDSTITMKYGSGLVSIDGDFNLNWITTGSYSHISDIEIARNTNEIIVVGTTFKNINFGNQTHHLILGEYRESGDLSTSFTDPEDRYYLSIRDLYILVLDQNGTPTNGEIIRKNLDTLSSYTSSMVKLVGSPCGDFTCSITNASIHSDDLDFTSNEVTSYVGKHLFVDWKSNCLALTNYCSGATLSEDSIYFCADESEVTVQLEEVYAVDSITYHLIANGLVSNVSVVALNGTNFSVPIPLEFSANGFICISSPFLDTVSYLASQPVEPTFDSVYFLECNDVLTLPFNAADYTSTQFLLNQVTTSNSFHSGNLEEGANSLTAYFYDALGCVIEKAVVINYFCDLGLSDNNMNFLLSVQPNPSNGQFTVTHTTDIRTLKFFKATGKLIHEQTNKKGNSITLDLDLADGVYFLQMTSKDGTTYIRKVVVHQ